MSMRNLMKISKPTLIVLTIVALLNGCATSPKVQVTQAGDNHLTKEQLLCEIDRLNEAERQVDSKRGVTGTNVAAALFFWPGLVYTHMDASEASRLIEQRRTHLTALYNQKLSQGSRPAPRR